MASNEVSQLPLHGLGQVALQAVEGDGGDVDLQALDVQMRVAGVDPDKLRFYRRCQHVGPDRRQVALQRQRLRLRSVEADVEHLTPDRDRRRLDHRISRRGW